MDRIDVGIIREMLDARIADPGRAYVKKTASEMARHLNVDENTIRTRMRKLQQCGFLKAWWMAINPSLVGQELYQVWFDVNRPSSKQDVVKKISLVPGVVVIKNLIGDSLSVMLYCEGADGFRKNSSPDNCDCELQRGGIGAGAISHSICSAERQ